MGDIYSDTGTNYFSGNGGNGVVIITFSRWYLAGYAG